MVLNTFLSYMLILQTLCVLLFDLLCNLFVYIILRFYNNNNNNNNNNTNNKRHKGYAMFSSLFPEILSRLCILNHFLFVQANFKEKTWIFCRDLYQ